MHWIIMPKPLVRAAGLALALAATLAACSPAATGLAPGLTARMDAPGADLDRREALGLANAYRASQGATALSADAGLDQEAQQLAASYAATGRPPRRPDGSAAMLVSAGYPNFANVFSGWRGSSDDARTMATPSARRAGIAVSYSENTQYGLYWVMLLAQ
jgi:uncharacterized protein YkwD